MHQLNIRLLGSPQVEVAGEPRKIGNGRALALLAYLAVADAIHTREKLATLIWPDWDRRSGRAYLRHALWALKQALGPGILRLAPEAVGLEPGLDLAVDVQLFWEHLAACTTHGHGPDDPCAHCAPHLTAAVALFRDDFLAGFSLPDSANFDEWQRQQAGHLRGQLAGALHKLARHHATQAEWESAIAYARRWLLLDPLHEPAHRCLMELYAYSGQWSAVLRQYEECTRVLARELDGAPSAETTALLEALKQEQRAAQPQPVSLERAVKEPAPAAVHLHNLPAPVTPFIGRRQETATVRQLLQGPTARLVTLTGPGGVGKTRLALHVAQQLVGDFADGIYLVTLAPLREEGLVLPAIAQALGIRETGNQPLLQTVKEALRSKQLLLVLDNFEHITAAAPAVAELLGAAPQIKVLIISRERLNLYGEHELPVPPFPVPPTEALPDIEAIAAIESVQLFQQRAQAAKPEFSLDTTNIESVAAICAQLEGLPLAIELAAAQIRRFAPETLLELLTDQSPLGLLHGGPRDLPQRQRSLSDTIAWSYNLLTAAEQQLFRRLAVFVGGSTVEAVWQVYCNLLTPEEGEAGTSNTNNGFSLHHIAERLDALADKNLLLQRVTEGGEGRYTMLQTIHAFGLLRLRESSEEDTVQRAHARYFMTLAEEAAPALRGAERERWLNRLEREHDNLRAALHWATEHLDAATGLRLGVALEQFWDTRGYEGEGYERLRRLLSNTPADDETMVRARALCGAGRLAEHCGEYIQSRSLLEQSIGLFKTLNDLAGMADALDHLGITMRTIGDYSASCHYHEQSLSILRGLDSPWRRAIVARNLAEAHALLGDYGAAELVLQEGLELARQLDNRFLLALLMGKSGHVRRMLGNSDQAQALLTESVALFRQAQDKTYLPFFLGELGLVACGLGNHKVAASHLLESLRLHAEVRNSWGTVFSLVGHVALLTAQGRPAQALRLAAAAVAARQASGAVMLPFEQTVIDEARAVAHQQLGEKATQEAWRQGEAMTLDEAVATALATISID